MLSFFVGFNIFMLPPLKARKLNHIDNLEKKIETALSMEEQNIGLFCQAWSDRRNLTAYIDNPGQNSLHEVFPDSLFFEDRLDLALVLKADGTVIFHKTYLRDKEFIDFAELKIDRETSAILKKIKEKPQPLAGIIHSNYGPLMTIARPLTEASGNAPGRAVLALGKFIDRRMIARLSLYTMENIKIYQLDKERINFFHAHTMRGKDFHYRDEKDRLVTFHLLKDINDRPGLIISSASGSREFKIINRHVAVFITFIFFLTILLCIALYRYIDRYFIKRMRRISSTMNRIEGLDDLSMRIEQDIQMDEISQLISNLNLTLDKLENEKVFRENIEKAMVTQGKLASIGRLSSNIAHEINNPILAISNCLQVIKKCVTKKNELVKEALEISEAEIDRTRKIISGLLDFHRPDKEFSTLNINDIVMQALEVLKWSNKLKSTRISCDFGEKHFVLGSPVKLQEVFMNLVLNAVEALEDMGDKGTLTITVKPSDDGKYVEIHFMDNGPGLPLEVRNSLFEPFISTRDNRGAGLGLYIAYKLVDIHNGEIIYNEEYKSGAHFIIKLPASGRHKNGRRTKIYHSNRG